VIEKMVGTRRLELLTSSVSNQRWTLGKATQGEIRTGGQFPVDSAMVLSPDLSCRHLYRRHSH
jgi:hypothetical protein